MKKFEKLAAITLLLISLFFIGLTIYQSSTQLLLNNILSKRPNLPLHLNQSWQTWILPVFTLILGGGLFITSQKIWFENRIRD